MALPDGFNEFEFLQNLVRKWQNRIVREEFQDLGGDDFDPDITISRHALRHGCTHKDTDTAEMTCLRNDLFYFLYRKARDLNPPVYGMPTDVFKELIKTPDQIYLFFAEDGDDATQGYPAIRSRHHIKLAKPIPEASWETQCLQLARDIKREFAATNIPYHFKKGNKLFTYQDLEHGHNFHIYSDTEADAVETIKKMLAIQDQTYQVDYLTPHLPKKNSVNHPSGTVLKFGKRRKKRRWRPEGIVKFRWATLQVTELERDLILVDTTGSFPEALVKA